MRVTPPVPITSLNLISCSATDIHAPAAYSAGTTYAVGAIVSVAADYAIYESLQSGNLGKTPSSEPLWWKQVGYTETLWSSGTTYPLGATCSGSNGRIYESLQAGNLNHALPVLPATVNAWWQDMAPTNRWAAFDSASNTQTVWTSPYTAVFRPGMRVNTLGITGMVADSVTIVGTSVFGGGVVYPSDYATNGPKVVDLIIRNVNDHYDFAFEPFALQPSVAFFDIPPYSDIEFTVTLTRSVGNIKVGAIIVGTYTYLGEVEYGARGDALNFSTIDRDLYGNATLVPRRSVPKVTASLNLPSARVNKVRAARTNLNAVPALWTGLDDGDSNWFDMLLVMGVYKTFEITAESYSNAKINLEIEEI